MLKLGTPAPLYLLPGASPGFAQGVTCNIGKACANRWLPERVTATAPYGQDLRRCFVYQESLAGKPSSVFEVDITGPRDSSHPIRAYLLRRQLVMILGRLNVPKNKVASAGLSHYCQGLRLALYKGLHATSARPVQTGGCRSGSRQPRLMGKTCEDALCPQELLTGRPSSVLRRIVPGLATCLTR